ncbi:hypothetical protein HJG60_008328 [Phyllostomus discolor]|uniref:Uncharacterized protein n=1 Tax=Phyllostomus discolor TaxID=89673 RepID=A0A833ZB67_9CHIR|nr:hypothetical protein HJG60_008328 [Phyllostomus discolor]
MPWGLESVPAMGLSPGQETRRVPPLLQDALLYRPRHRGGHAGAGPQARAARTAINSALFPSSAQSDSVIELPSSSTSAASAPPRTRAGPAPPWGQVGRALCSPPRPQGWLRKALLQLEALGQPNPHFGTDLQVHRRGHDGQVGAPSLDSVEGPVSSGGTATMPGTEAPNGARPPFTGPGAQTPHVAL